MERGIPIRSISRSITVLQAINRYGALSLMEISRASGLPYPTACRILQTLLHEGLVECEATRKRYRATGLVRTLSQGFVNRDELIRRARPFIVALTRKFGWPVAITTRIGQSMMIRDNTQDLTALTFNFYPAGYTMPLLECGSGQVYVAHLDDEARRQVIDALAQADSRAPALARFRSDEAIARIREDGFVAHERGQDPINPGTMSSLSVPLRDDTHLAGALALVFFSSAMKMSDAVARYLPELKATAAAIAEAMVASRSAAGPDDDAAAQPRARARSFGSKALSV